MVNARDKPLIVTALMLVMFPLMGCLHGSASATGVDGNLVITIWTSGTCVQPGDTVNLRATVSNHGSITETMDVKDQPVLDIFIFRPGIPSSYAVHWSDSKPLTPDLTHLELKPGESKTIEMDWVAPSIKETYDVDAIFIYSDIPPRVVARAGVTINVGTCPGIGP